MTINRAVLAGFFLLLPACSTPLPKNFQYSSDMNDGLVAFGVAPPSNSVSISFAAIDPETCRLTKFAGIGDKTYGFNEWIGEADHTKYVIGKFEPGTYVIDNFSRQAGYMTTAISALNVGTFAFEVKPGDFIYLGDFRLAGNQPVFLGFHRDALTEELTKYPGISKEPVDSATVRTPFSGQRDGGRIPGCNLQP